MARHGATPVGLHRDRFDGFGGECLSFFPKSLADPTPSDPIMGVLVAVGFCGGIVVATVVGVIVAKAHGRWVPPI
jgi:hypothetical protein